MKKVPVQLVLGDGEAEAGTVSIRRQGEKESLTVPFEEFIQSLRLEIEEKR